MQYLRAIIEISVYENLPNLESYRIFQSKSNWLYQFLNVFKLEYSRILFKNLKLFKYGEVDSFSRLDSTCPIFSKFLPSFLIHFRPKWIRKLGKNLEKIGQVLKTAWTMFRKTVFYWTDSRIELFQSCVAWIFCFEKRLLFMDWFGPWINLEHTTVSWLDGSN